MVKDLVELTDIFNEFDNRFNVMSRNSGFQGRRQ